MSSLIFIDHDDRFYKLFIYIVYRLYLLKTIYLHVVSSFFCLEEGAENFSTWERKGGLLNEGSDIFCLWNILLNT